MAMVENEDETRFAEFKRAQREQNAIDESVGPAPQAMSGTVACCIEHAGVIYAFTTTGSIYRVQTKPFQIELLWVGPLPGTRGPVAPGAVPPEVSRPSRYGGN